MTRDEEIVRTGLERLGPVPDDAWAAFREALTRRELARGEQWLIAGERTHEVGFIAAGLLRMVYTRDDGREFNKSFLQAGDSCAALDALVLGVPSRLTIQALQPSVMLVVAWTDLEALYDRFPALARIGRRAAELLAVKKMRREASFLLDSAEDRYLAFRRQHRDIENAIADYHIASYVGVTAEALSRIKKRVDLSKT